MKRMFTQNNMSKIAMVLGMLVFPLAYWWGHHMSITDSAIDQYPSRWIYSWPFVLLIFAGSISGSAGIGSFLANQTVRIFYGILLGFINPLIFLGTIHDKFEYGVYDGVSILSKISDMGAWVCILGWLVSLSAVPIVYWIKRGKKARETRLKTKEIIESQ